MDPREFKGEDIRLNDRIELENIRRRHLGFICPIDTPYRDEHGQIAHSDYYTQRLIDRERSERGRRSAAWHDHINRRVAETIARRNAANAIRRAYRSWNLRRVAVAPLRALFRYRPDLEERYHYNQANPEQHVLHLYDIDITRRRRENRRRRAELDAMQRRQLTRNRSFYHDPSVQRNLDGEYDA